MISITSIVITCKINIKFAYLDSQVDNDFQVRDVECIEFAVIYVLSLFRRAHYRWVTIKILHTTIDAQPVVCINYVVT